MTAKTQAPVKTETKPLNVDRSGILQRKCDCGKSASLTGQCSECNAKNLLQRRSTDSTEVAEVPPIVHEVLRSPGQPLDSDTRRFMESRFNQGLTQPVQRLDSSVAKSGLSVGAASDRYEQEADRVAGQVMRSPSLEMPASSSAHDFSQVSIHADDKANQSAVALNAQAYTLNHKIVFREGRYTPHTLEGKELLAHELTHVLQQQSQPGTLQTKL